MPHSARHRHRRRQRRRHHRAARSPRRGLADVVLVDIVEGLPQGKALDLAEAAPVVGHDMRVTGTNDYADTAGSDVIVVTSGLAAAAGHEPRRPAGQERGHRAVAWSAGGRRTPRTRSSSWSPTRSTRCATSRSRRAAFRRSASSAWPACSTRRASGRSSRRSWASASPAPHAFVLGGHGDTMVPLPRYSTVGGVPITELLPAERIEALVDRTRNGGAEVVALLKTGSAFYAPAASRPDGRRDPQRPPR